MFSRPTVSFVISSFSSIDESRRLTFAFDQSVPSTIRDCFILPSFEASRRTIRSSSVCGGASRRDRSRDSVVRGTGTGIEAVRESRVDCSGRSSDVRTRASAIPASIPPSKPISKAIIQSIPDVNWRNVVGPTQILTSERHRRPSYRADRGRHSRPADRTGVGAGGSVTVASMLSNRPQSSDERISPSVIAA